MRDLIARTVAVGIIAYGFVIMSWADGSTATLLVGAAVVLIGAMLLIVGYPL